jgi:hypothetical protein
MRGNIFKALLLAFALLGPVAGARACPSCQEAVSLSDDADTQAADEARLARAYNHSIYLMVGMPYFLLGVLGFLVYRGLKQRSLIQAAASSQGEPPLQAGPDAVLAPDGQGASACPTPSAGVVS